jgi:hypothetical protein
LLAGGASMALPVAAEADDPVADPGDRLGRARPRFLITHCTELPTAITRTDSDWTRLGRRSRCACGDVKDSAQMLNSRRTSPSS